MFIVHVVTGHIERSKWVVAGIPSPPHVIDHLFNLYDCGWWGWIEVQVMGNVFSGQLHGGIYDGRAVRPFMSSANVLYECLVPMFCEIRNGYL